VKSGTLLLVSKALVRTCIQPGSEEGRRVSKLMSMDFDDTETGDTAAPRIRKVEKTSYYLHAVDAMHTLMRNPHLTKEFYSLWAGEQWDMDEKALSGIPLGVVDAWRVERTIAANSFRTNEVESVVDLPNSGLWLLPSVINHSCLGRLLCLNGPI